MELGLRTRAATRGGRSPDAWRRADAMPGGAAVKTDILRMRERRAGLRGFARGEATAIDTGPREANMQPPGARGEASRSGRTRLHCVPRAGRATLRGSDRLDIEHQITTLLVITKQSYEPV